MMSEQTLGNFYLSCDTIHRELYSVIIREWQEAGLEWSWADRAIALGRRSVIKDQLLNFFYLNPGENIYPASISLDTDVWHDLLGQEVTDAFLRELKAIHSLSCKQQDNIFSIEDPGHLSGPSQQMLRDVLGRFAFRIPELVAS